MTTTSAASLKGMLILKDGESERPCPVRVPDMPFQASDARAGKNASASLGLTIGNGMYNVTWRLSINGTIACTEDEFFSGAPQERLLEHISKSIMTMGADIERDWMYPKFAEMAQNAQKYSR